MNETLHDRITDLSNGDQLILDGHAGAFTVLRRKFEPTGNTQVGVEVLDENLEKFELRHVDTGFGGPFLDLRSEDRQTAVRITGTNERIRDFEVVGHDTRPIEQHIAKMYE